MQCDRLHADKVLPTRKSSRDREVNAGHVLSGERDRGAAVSHSRDLIHLEPDVAIARPRRRILARWHLGHVHVDDAGVVHGPIRLDADGGAGGDLGGGRGRVRLGGVAGEVGGGDVGDLERGLAGRAKERGREAMITGCCEL